MPSGFRIQETGGKALFVWHNDIYAVIAADLCYCFYFFSHILDLGGCVAVLSIPCRDGVDHLASMYARFFLPLPMIPKA